MDGDQRGESISLTAVGERDAAWTSVLSVLAGSAGPAPPGWVVQVRQAAVQRLMTSSGVQGDVPTECLNVALDLLAELRLAGQADESGRYVGGCGGVEAVLGSLALEVS